MKKILVLDKIEHAMWLQMGIIYTIINGTRVTVRVSQTACF